MKNFLIHVLDENTFESYGLECCTGEIVINDYKETFEMPLEYWSIDDYRKQWQEGIERLRAYDQSCLIAEIQDFEKTPRVNMWVLYKVDNVVYIQNNLLFGKRFVKMLKKEPFNIKTCYNFIPRRETISNCGMPISEWSVSVENFFKQIER